LNKIIFKISSKTPHALKQKTNPPTNMEKTNTRLKRAQTLIIIKNLKLELFRMIVFCAWLLLKGIASKGINSFFACKCHGWRCALKILSFAPPSSY